MKMKIAGLVVGSLLTAAPAFAQQGTAPAAAQGTAPAAAPAGEEAKPADAKPAFTPTDPQIAAIVMAANQVDIDAAKMAKGKTKNKAVKQFAETMIRDHSAVNKEVKALAKKTKMKPEDNTNSKNLTGAGKQSMTDLKKKKGADFDKAYVDNEIAYHQQVIDVINNTLIPAAQNADLKAMLTRVAPAIQAHLDHAKKLQGELAEAK
jgi:putative membrane protein